MKTTITWIVTSVFGHEINTDDIIRADVLQESTNKEFFAQFAFQKFDPDFVFRCSRQSNNIILWWDNFWCWSSREQAVYALIHNWVKAVIAKSFPDIFYRNSINNWLILIRQPKDMVINLWDTIEIDLDAKSVINTSTWERKTFSCDDKDLNIMKHGWNLEMVLSYINSWEYDVTVNKVQKWQTIVEKIISDHVWQKVYAESHVWAIPIDLIYLNEVIAPASIKFYQKDFGDLSLFDASKVCFIPDHSIPSCSIEVSKWIDLMKDFAQDKGIKMYKSWRWIEHIVFIEDKKILPWNIVLWTDSHTCTAWGINALAFWVWTTDAEYAMASWALFNFTVPETIRVNLDWAFRPWVYAKDLILTLLWLLWAKWASKKILEFWWPALANLSIDARTTISNMAVEMSWRSWIFEFDTETEKYLWLPDIKAVNPDIDATYSQIINLDLSQIEPTIALPHSPENTCSISNLPQKILESQRINSNSFPAIDESDTLVTECFIWACTNWKYEDLEVAAQILKWHKVHPNVDLIIIPASSEIYLKAVKNWLIEIFSECGAMIEAPNCGPCFGKHLWVASGRTRILSSSNRNYKWRMWHESSLIFLASPATVAASAINWQITDPRLWI